MSDLSKLTARDFSDAMHKGWEGRNWGEDAFRVDANGHLASDVETAVTVCAIGAMSCALNADPFLICDILDEAKIDWGRIANASDEAGNKRAAMKAVDEILLAKVSS